MRKIKALFVFAFVILSSIPLPIWAADFTELPSYRSTVLLGDREIIEGYGSTAKAAKADAMRVCLNLSDECTLGATSVWGWMHFLVICPELNVHGILAFMPPDPSRMGEWVTDNPELNALSRDDIYFECNVDRDYLGQPVHAWLITTH